MRGWIVVTGLTFGVALATIVAAEDRVDPRPSISRWGTPAGIQCYIPDTWGIVSVDLINPTESPVEPLATLYFDGIPNVQYARRIWVPPQARRATWCPVRIPSRFPPKVERVGLKSLLLETDVSRDTVVQTRSETVLDDGILSLDRSSPVTGLLFDGLQISDEESGAPYEAAIAARGSLGLSRRIAQIYDPFLPPTAESWQGLDQLVVTGNQLAGDAAGRLALRRWLHAGGRLWIMLDRVQPETVQLLLGDAFRGDVVDRVGLTEVQIQKVGKHAPPEPGPRHEFEIPVELVRVLAPEAEVVYNVQGWPAAFWQTAGKGRILFTTLGARGWMRLRTPSDPRPADIRDDTKYVAGEPLKEMARELFKPLPESRGLNPAQFRPFLAEQVGYRTAGRGTVLAVLGLFCLGLLGAGVWLERRKRLEHLAWIGTGAAGVAAAALASVGISYQQSIPPTAAIAQYAEVPPGGLDLSVTGLLELYQPKSTPLPMGARRGGVILPDSPNEAGAATRRMVWTDFDAWHWENLVLPQGVWLAPFEYSVPLENPIVARATFGPAGLTGSCSAGAFDGLSDAIVAMPSGRCVSVDWESQQVFQARNRGLLPPRQFIAGSLLSDEQRRRQAIYEQLLPDGEHLGSPRRPLLYFWARPLEMQFVFPQEARQVGSALIAVPLEFERPAPETEIQLSAAFLPYQTTRSPHTGALSGLYDHRTGEWQETGGSSETWLRFQLPPELFPFRVSQVTLSLQITGPAGGLEIRGLSGGKPVSLATRAKPIGTMQFEIGRADVLQVDEGGGIVLGVSLGDSTQSRAGEFDPNYESRRWKIDTLSLEASGRTVEDSLAVQER
jgi:hypothetical protein